MSLILAAAKSGRAVLAADRRATCRTTTGGTVFCDCGGKLLRIGDGWLASAGQSMLVTRASVEELLRRGRLDHLTVSTVRLGVAERLSALVAPHGDLAMEFHEEAQSTFQFTARHGQVTVYDWRGGVVARFTNDALGFYPSESLYGGPADEDYRRRIRDAASQFDLVRAMARQAARVATESDLVSPDIEIAVENAVTCNVELGTYRCGPAMLSGDAATLAETDDAALTSMLTPPPTPSLVDHDNQIADLLRRAGKPDIAEDWTNSVAAAREERRQLGIDYEVAT